MSYDLFISYTRRDNQDERITQLVKRIKQDFARMIAAQALAHDVAVLSPDPELDHFGVRRIW
jgi:PIN domain nuclease of toxin-antitoxin system